MARALPMCLLLAATIAFAQTKSKPPDAKALVTAAQTAYAAGQYVEAAALLEKARTLEDSGRIVYNLARAYEKAGDTAKAITCLEQYLERRDAEKAIVPKARATLAKLYKEDAKAKAAAETAVTPVEPAPKPEPEPAPVEAAPEPAPKSEAVLTPPPPREEPAAVVIATPPPPRSSPFKVPGAVLTALGAAGLLGAGGVGYWAQSLASQEHATTDPELKPRLRSEALERATAADIAFVCGGIVLAAGVTLLILAVATSQ